MIVLSCSILFSQFKEIKEVTKQLRKIAEVQSEIKASMKELKSECDKIKNLFEKNICTSSEGR